MMMTENPGDRQVDAELIALHDAYVRQVNAAVSADRDGLACDLARDFSHDARELLAASSRGAHWWPGLRDKDSAGR
jgi:hypothetical protein